MYCNNTVIQGSPHMKLVGIYVSFGNIGPRCTLISQPVIGQGICTSTLHSVQIKPVAQFYEPENLAEALCIAVHIVAFYG